MRKERKKESSKERKRETSNTNSNSKETCTLCSALEQGRDVENPRNHTDVSISLLVSVAETRFVIPAKGFVAEGEIASSLPSSQ